MTRRFLLLAVYLFAAPLLASQQTFRTSTDAIFVPVSVTDKNRPVANLTAADFELFDNDVKQEFTLTTLDSQPTDVTVLIDTSGSVTGAALQRIQADAQQMADLLQPNDRIRLVAFARDATDVFGILPGGATLDFSRMRSGGTTSLYDALIQVLTAFPSGDRPHMVFAVTDGRDNSSFSGSEQVVAVSRVSSAVLSIALVPSTNPLIREGGKIDTIDPMASEQSTINVPTLMPAVSGAGNVVVPGTKSASNAISRSVGPFRGGPNIDALRAAATATGGLLHADSTRTPVPQLFRQILDDFRAGYLLSYAPSGVDGIGTHAITIKVRNKNLTVRSRKTYEQR